jgi:hypothetical protein
VIKAPPPQALPIVAGDTTTIIKVPPPQALPIAVMVQAPPKPAAASSKQTTALVAPSSSSKSTRTRTIYKPTKMKTIQFDVTFNKTILELGLGTSERGQVMVTQVINPLSKVHVEDMMISIGNENIQHQSISLVVNILRRTLRPVVIRFQRVIPVRKTRAKNGNDDVR